MPSKMLMIKSDKNTNCPQSANIFPNQPNDSPYLYFLMQMPLMKMHVQISILMMKMLHVRDANAKNLSHGDASACRCSIDQNFSFYSKSKLLEARNQIFSNSIYSFYGLFFF